MDFLINLIPTLFVLGLLILIHELGHFIACRLTGVRVEKFSIGFGPEILHFQGPETRYAVSLLPFGGYVKPSGETFSEIKTQEPAPHDFLAASIPKRLFIVTAGVGMNYLLSFVLFVTIFVMGRPVLLAQIGGLVEGYPAAASGIQKGDRVVSVDGVSVTSWEELTEGLRSVKGTQVTLEIEPASPAGGRRNRIKSFQIPVRLEEVEDIFGKTHTLARIGILPDPEVHAIKKVSFGEALREAWFTEIHLTAMTYKAIYYLLTGQLSLKTVSGPIGIMSMTGTAAKMGAVYLLHLTAVLGISLAVINLLPIPALDGGHLVFLLIEALRGKRVSLKFQERATQVGFVLLMALMAFVIYNDLVNLEFFTRLRIPFGQ